MGDYIIECIGSLTRGRQLEQGHKVHLNRGNQGRFSRVVFEWFWEPMVFILIVSTCSRILNTQTQVGLSQLATVAEVFVINVRRKAFIMHSIMKNDLTVQASLTCSPKVS